MGSENASCLKIHGNDFRRTKALLEAPGTALAPCGTWVLGQREAPDDGHQGERLLVENQNVLIVKVDNETVEKAASERLVKNAQMQGFRNPEE